MSEPPAEERRVFPRVETHDEALRTQHRAAVDRVLLALAGMLPTLVVLIHAIRGCG